MVKIIKTNNCNLKLLGISLLFGLILPSFLSYRAVAQLNSPRRIAIFVNGNMDCCASNMQKVKKEFQNLGIEIRETAWNSINKKSESQSPRNTNHFIKTATKYFDGLPAGTEVFLIGHSFGGDSVLQFLSQYRKRNIKFVFVAVLDSVGYAGRRDLTRDNQVGSNVNYFFNRWQNNSPWPVDYRSSGKLACEAKECDQEPQSISRHPDGKARKTKCGDLEITCPGYRVDITRPPNTLLPSKVIPGEKQTRLHHQYVPTDPYIETQIIGITKRLSKRNKLLCYFYIDGIAFLRESHQCTNNGL